MTRGDATAAAAPVRRRGAVARATRATPVASPRRRWARPATGWRHEPGRHRRDRRCSLSRGARARAGGPDAACEHSLLARTAIIAEPSSAGRRVRGDCDQGAGDCAGDRRASARRLCGPCPLRRRLGSRSGASSIGSGSTNSSRARPMRPEEPWRRWALPVVARLCRVGRRRHRRAHVTRSISWPRDGIAFG